MCISIGELQLTVHLYIYMYCVYGCYQSTVVPSAEVLKYKQRCDEADMEVKRLTLINKELKSKMEVCVEESILAR